MSDDELKSSMNRMILDQEVKQYVINNAFIKINLNKIFAIIWRQYTADVQSVLKGDDFF